MENKKAAELLSANLKSIYGYAFARLYDKEDADDLTSEIVTEVLKSSSRIQNDDAFWGFLWKVAENTFRKFIKRKERRDDIALFSDGDAADGFSPSPEEEIEQKESINLLRRELSLLSKVNREICLEYYFRNKTCKEITDTHKLSLEMVKYHLFKTRQLLKEGIGMERTFGEKSYNPANFEFNTIFSGTFNREYRNLFSRKLPGNILHSAYYTPMTIRELSLELGVSSVYMEDEVALLEKYRLLTPLPGGRYQTNLVIFTSDYTVEFYTSSREICTERIRHILAGVKELLPEIRKIGFSGNTLDDDRLLWPLLWFTMQKGHAKVSESQTDAADKIYDGATGINYGITCDFSAYDEGEKQLIEDCECTAFAGYAGLDDNYASSFVDFGVLPKKCRYDSSAVKASLTGKNAEYPVFTTEQIKRVENLLSYQINEMTSLYGTLHEIAVKLMKQHSPESVGAMTEKIIAGTLFFHTAGFIGKCGVDSGLLAVPDDGRPVAVFVYEICDADKQNASKDNLCQ